MTAQRAAGDAAAARLGAATSQTVLALQRAAGNSAVAPCMTGAAATGEEAEWSHTLADDGGSDYGLEPLHDGRGAPGACVVSEAIPATRSGIINQTGSVGERFTVRIEWRPSPIEPEHGSYCSCRCGEYRQYVRGHLIINGRREQWRLHGGSLLDEHDWREDGGSNPKSRYGHRDEPQTMDEDYLPDRATGCTYVGRDYPRVTIGSDVDVRFQFRGQSYDRCRNVFGPIHEWEFAYVGPINR